MGRPFLDGFPFLTPGLFILHFTFSRPPMRLIVACVLSLLIGSRGFVGYSIASRGFQRRITPVHSQSAASEPLQKEQITHETTGKRITQEMTGIVVPTKRVPPLAQPERPKPVTTTPVREMVSFGIPVSALFLSNFALGAVDTATTGRFGGITDLAALAPGTAAMEYSCYVLSAITTLILNQLAPTTPGSTEWHQLLKKFISLVMIAAVFQTTGTFVFAEGLARMVGCPAEVVCRAAGYLRWRAIGLLPYHLAAACSSCFFAAKDSVTPLAGTVLAVAINIIGDLLLCPRYGLVGAAAATSASQACLFAFLYTRLKRRSLVPPNLFGSSTPPKELLRLLRLVAPVSMLTLMRTALYALLSFWCCQMGLVASAAQQIASTVFWGATNAAGEPIGAAAQTFVPARYKAWRDAEARAMTVAAAPGEQPTITGDAGDVDAAEAAAGHAYSELRLTIRRLASTCVLFSGGVALGVYGLTCAGPLSIFTSHAAAISQVPQAALVAIAVICPFALLCEGTLLRPLTLASSISCARRRCSSSVSRSCAATMWCACHAGWTSSHRWCKPPLVQATVGAWHTATPIARRADVCWEGIRAPTHAAERLRPQHPSLMWAERGARAPPRRRPPRRSAAPRRRAPGE